MRAFAVHPGGILTPLQRHLPREEMVARAGSTRTATPPTRFKTPEQGAATAAWAATSPQLDGHGRRLLRGLRRRRADRRRLGPRGSGASTRYATDPEAAARLWTLSAELTGVDAFAAA